MVQLVPSGMWQSLIGRWIVEAPSDMGAGLHTQKKMQKTIHSNRFGFHSDKENSDVHWPGHSLLQLQHDQVGTFRAADQPRDAQPRVSGRVTEVLQTDLHTVVLQVWNTGKAQRDAS